MVHIECHGGLNPLTDIWAKLKKPEAGATFAKWLKRGSTHHDRNFA